MKKFDKVDWLIFVISILGIALINYCGKGKLYFESPDGNLYFSIAKNFVDTGHFIQTARTNELGFVVPFGLPLIYTILYALFHGIRGIVFVQYIIFGILFVLIRRVAKCLFRIPFMDMLMLWIVFWNDSFQLYINPAYLLTEVWTAFLIVLWIYMYMSIKDITKQYSNMLICSIALMCIRPAFSLFFIVTLIMCILQMIKDKHIYKKYICILSAFLILCFINTAVNYRETGTIVLFENYSGLAFYQANNVNTKTYGYSSAAANDFVEERFWPLENNAALTRGEKSKIMSVWARDYILSNLGKVVSNIYEKFINLFVINYRWDIYILPIALILIPKVQKKKGIIIAAIILSEAIITSMGLVLHRYSSFIIPIYVLFKVWLLDSLINLFKTKFSKVSKDECNISQ